jgi:predicted metal-dependent enzyme (double-stranded beta helix superfamily)
MFEVQRLVEDCRAALGKDAAHGAIREIVARAVSDPGSVLGALGEPQRAGIQPLHRSDTLTILNVIWAPHMTLPPHDHRMWAVIGIYTGREDNIFWRRAPGDASKVEASGAKALCERDAEPLGHRIIHSVTNPIPRFTGAIHVYGGDFFGVLRSEWDAESLVEGSWDTERTTRRFEEANARFERRSAGG